MNLSLPLFDPADLPLPVAGLGRAAPPKSARRAEPAESAELATAAPTQAQTAAVSPAGLADPADPADLVDPVGLHPSLWRASQVGGGRLRCTASGFALLDEQLPGGGWPHGELTELLLAQPGIGELRLLAPALRAIAPRCVMLFEPPARLSAWGLAQQGLDSRHWLVVTARQGPGQDPGQGPASPLPVADLLWALEQALRSGQVGAVLAWLPQRLRADALRRLQLAAQAHDGPVFLLRDTALHRHPSAAPLRLLLRPQGVDGLGLQILKRRGPPLDQGLALALPPVLTPGQQARAMARLAVAQAARPAGAVLG